MMRKIELVIKIVGLVLVVIQEYQEQKSNIVRELFD